MRQRERKDKYVEYFIDQNIRGALGRPHYLGRGPSCLLVRTNQATGRQWGSISSATDPLSSYNKIIISKFIGRNNIKD